jgi:hypothetical protein
VVIKQCVICDNIIKDDRAYRTNHYLCSSDCGTKYNELSTWNEVTNFFNVNLKGLNFHRLKVQGIKELTAYELNYRRDF